MPKIIATAEAQNNGELYATKINVHQFHFLADEPHESGGKDLGPDPNDYVCMALASCTVITLRMYAERKKWKVDEIRVKINLVKGAETASGNNTFYVDVSVTGDLSDEQRKRLTEIANACPVHRLITKASDVVTRIV